MTRRCYLDPREWDKKRIQITGREAHHLAHVLRVRPQTEVTCFDGQGQEADGVVTRVTRHEVILDLKEKRQVHAPAWRLSLGVAIPRRSKLDQIIDQAAQLGVHEILPLLTSRGVVKGNVKRDRLLQIAIEAAKQSGVSRLPILHPATPWWEGVRSFGSYDGVLMATVEGPHEDLGELLSDSRLKNLLILIGPEGDFTPAEIQEAVQAGAHRISLGPTVLRVETAAVAAVSGVRFFLISHSRRIDSP